MRIYKVFSRAVLFLLLWWVLVAADPASLVFGAPAAAAAAFLSLRLHPLGRAGIRAWKLIPLFGAFFLHGLRGGLDVAWRAIHPRLPIHPGWTKVRLASDHAAANTLLGGMVSLVPGSLAAAAAEGTMDLHLLDAPSFDPQAFERDQSHVLGVFDGRIDMGGSFHV